MRFSVRGLDTFEPARRGFTLCSLLLAACSAGGASTLQGRLTKLSPPSEPRLIDNPLKVEPKSGCAEVDFYWQDGDALIVNCDGDTKAFLPPFDEVASVQVEPKPVVESVKPANESYSIEVDEHTVAICGEGRLSLNQTNTQSKVTLGPVPYCGPMAVRPNRELWLWPQGVKDPSWAVWETRPFMRWDLKTRKLLPTPSFWLDPFILYFPRIESFWVNDDRVVRNLGNRVVATDFHGSEPKLGWSFSGADSDQRSLMSKSRDWIATTCARSSVCVLNTATGENHQVAHPAFTYLPRTVSLIRSSSGRLLASGAADESLRVFELRSGALHTIVDSIVIQKHLLPAHVSPRTLTMHDKSLRWSLATGGLLRLHDDGGTATLTAHKQTWELSFATGRWGTKKSEVALPGPHGFTLQAGRLERQAESNTQEVPVDGRVDSFVVSEDGTRIALKNGSTGMVELWTTVPPFKQLQEPVDLKGFLQGINRDGTIFWTDEFLARAGHVGLTSTKSLQPSDLYVTRDNKLWARPSGAVLSPGKEHVQAPVDIYSFLPDGSLEKAGSTLDPFSPERMTRAEFGHWAEGTAVQTLDTRFLFTWAPKWFAQVLPNGTIEIGAAPGKPAMVSLRTVDHRDAGYVFTTDGRYDLLGSEAEQAARFLVCTDHGERVAFEQCKSRREPGLLAHVIAQLEQAPN